MKTKPRRHSVVQLSIVVPLFNEEATLAELHHRLTTVLKAIASSYEIILVDDGSVDHTYFSGCARRPANEISVGNPGDSGPRR